jgi:hypothetical protein
MCAVGVCLSLFKTAIVAIVALPFVVKRHSSISFLLHVRSLVLMSVVFCAIATTELPQAAMVMTTTSLSTISTSVGGRRLDTGTSLWRASIWSSALQRLLRENDLVFGQMPGFNFMSRTWLGISKHDKGGFRDRGGDALGANRMAHNFAVQLVMKNGVVGLALFFWYYGRCRRYRSPILVGYELATLVMAATATILETPYGGPVFYGLMATLEGNSVSRAFGENGGVARRAGRRDGTETLS